MGAVRGDPHAIMALIPPTAPASLTTWAHGPVHFKKLA